MSSAATAATTTTTTTEARLVDDKNFLFLFPGSGLKDLELRVGETFCGTVYDESQPEEEHEEKKETEEVDWTSYAKLQSEAKKNVFVGGDIAKAPKSTIDLLKKLGDRVFVVKDLCTNYESVLPTAVVVELGQVPILIGNGMGVHYRKFFPQQQQQQQDDDHQGYFHKIQAEHEFQALKFAGKPGVALRTGIYLTPVHTTTTTNESGDDEIEKHFRLLRCSTNLNGPTADFQPTDWEIVNPLNDQVETIFENAAPLNHVLTQKYPSCTVTTTSAASAATTTTSNNSNDNNKTGTNNNNEQNNNNNTKKQKKKRKQRKATIKAHADKTKDMPTDGIMAFPSFFDFSTANKKFLRPIGSFDMGHKGVSALPKLHFTLKACVDPEARTKLNLVKQFTVTLYPDSVFFMPLSTNRYYQHEIRPSCLEAHMLPTRMGYVVRCSNTEAVHKKKTTTATGGAEWATFIKTNNAETGEEELVELEPPTPEGLAELHRLYKEENLTDKMMEYGHVPFSMNAGDYAMPMTYNVQGGREEFRRFELNLNMEDVDDNQSSLFEKLQTTTQLEVVGKGRQGGVLVLPNNNCNGGVLVAPGSGSDDDNSNTVTVPLVRTTSKYQKPAQKFNALHQEIANRIQRCANLPMPFDNGLAEIYNDQYTKMGFHSDQAQDLLNGSYIALFSCYKNPTNDDLSAAGLRKLVVEPKDDNPNGETFEILLTHNTVVVWGLDTNRRFRHKIVPAQPNNNNTNQEWFGLTFRTSKTFVEFKDSGDDDKKKVAILVANGGSTPLKLVDVQNDREYYKMRGKENKEIDFHYPHLDFTISKSDLMPPIDYY